jgi:hypothetical protein
MNSFQSSDDGDRAVLPKAGFSELLARKLGLNDALLGQVRVEPPAEFVEFVPLRLSMPHEHNLVRRKSRFRLTEMGAYEFGIVSDMTDMA